MIKIEVIWTDGSKLIHNFDTEEELSHFIEASGNCPIQAKRNERGDEAVLYYPHQILKINIFRYGGTIQDIQEFLNKGEYHGKETASGGE